MKPKIIRHHLDKRAAELAALPGDDDDLLTPKQLCELLGVTPAWAANGRSYGWGPPAERMTPKMVVYRRGRVRAWLRERAHLYAWNYAPPKTARRIAVPKPAKEASPLTQKRRAAA